MKFNRKDLSLILIKNILKDTNIINSLSKMKIIRDNSFKKWINIRLTNNYKKNHIGKIDSYYNYSNRIYNWYNNNIINNINIDNIVKLWFKLYFSMNIRNNLTKIHTSEPIFLHTNDNVKIYIRILLPKKRKYMKDNNKLNYLYHYKIIINNLIFNNKISIINILNLIYNKKVIIIPIIVKYHNMSEFIINNNKIYTFDFKGKRNIKKLHRFIFNKSNIENIKFTNNRSLFNILYINNINNNLLNNNNNENYINLNLLNINNTILSNLNNRYIIGYNMLYAGKLPKADSSARSIKRNTMIGAFHNSNISKNIHYNYNRNGLASVIGTIAQY